MQGTQRRQFEMLQRVREFGNTYRDVLTTSSAGQELLTAIGEAIDELTKADVAKLSAAKVARGERKGAARVTLVDVLRKGSQLARGLRAEGYALPPCDMPVSQSDQSLLAAGRQLAVEAGRFATEFDAHGLPAAAITRAVTVFDRAAGERGVGQADRVAVSARIRGLLTASLLRARRLDLIVAILLANDEAALAVWKQARRVQALRGARGSRDDAAETPAGDPPVPGPLPAPGAEVAGGTA